jgi:hypothetical protein
MRKWLNVKTTDRLQYPGKGMANNEIIEQLIYIFVITF